MIRIAEILRTALQIQQYRTGRIQNNFSYADVTRFERWSESARASTSEFAMTNDDKETLDMTRLMAKHRLGGTYMGGM